MVDTEDRVLTEHEVTRIWTMAVMMAEMPKRDPLDFMGTAARLYFWTMRRLADPVWIVGDETGGTMLRRREDGQIERVSVGRRQ